MQKKIYTLSFSVLQGRTVFWSVSHCAGIPVSGKTTLSHLLIERINLAMTFFSLGIFTEDF